MSKPLAAWEALNDRQRIYLKAIFEIDQEKEEHQKLEGARGNFFNRKPASEWRWIKYYSQWGKSRLQQAIGAEHIDQGTGATFEALRQRGLIETKGGGDLYNLYVKMATAGRAAVRAGLDIKSTSKPAGLLSKSSWKALKLAYEAGETGVPNDNYYLAKYGGIAWEVWVRLRNHKSDVMVKEHGASHTIRITAAGRALYESRLELHRREYPDLYEQV